MSRQSLEIRSPSRENREVALSGTLVKIGRAPDNDVILEDTGRQVSRWHASIRLIEDAAPLLSDLKSANGTLLNGELVSGEASLRPNDAILIGPHILTYREEADTPLPFSIEEGKLDLARLQSQERLLDLAGDVAPGASGLPLLEILHEVSVTLARAHTVEEVKSQAGQLLFKIEPVHRACMMLWDEKSASFQESEVRLRGKGSGPAPAVYDPRNLVLSRTILDHVRQHNRPLLIRDARADQLLSSSVSIARAGIQAAFCSPLTFHGKFLGILYADNLAAPDAFTDADFRTFTSIAAQTGLALANALAGEEISRQQVERAAMRLYLPAQVVNLIAESGGSIQLGGTMKSVSVLFADIRGFTTLSERLDAREVVHVLNELFTVMSEVIFDAGGTLDKFIGDCVMALFGAPVAFDDDPKRALNAAIGIQRRVEALNRQRVARNSRLVQVGVGIHHGPAVVGNIGSADRMQYTAIGDTVNIAARLVSRAEPDQILVSGEFYDLVRNNCTFEPLGAVELKGKQNRIEAYAAKWNTVTATTH